MNIGLDKIIADLVQDVSKAAIVKMYETGSAQYKKALVSLELAFKRYLKSSYERYSKIKTLLYRDRPVQLRAHYVPSDFELGEDKICGTEILQNLLTSKRSIVSGTAGSGKSVLLRRLFLDMVEGPHHLAPILVELRLIEPSEQKHSIFNYIHKTISELEEGFSIDQLHYAFKQGKIALLLDGYDEIDFAKRESYEREILEISRKYPAATIIVSSRPDDCFSSWEEFHVYNALPLTKDQAAELIKRIEYDTTVKEKFTKELQTGLYELHQDFLSNPLLLTMMLLTYEQLAEIPEKIHIFYEQAFDTLFHKHDALKALYKRKSYTGLPIDDFKRLFAAFCILTYSDRKMSFSFKEANEYIRQAIELEGIYTEPLKFFNDLIKSVCILQKDGNLYTFTHRSFQEYFSAYFISNSQSLDFKEFLDSLLQGVFTDSVLSMLFELNREKVEVNWVLPRLRKLVVKCREAFDEKNHPKFLSIFYQSLCYHDECIAFQFYNNDSTGYFSGVLRRMYLDQAKKFFPTQDDTDDTIKEKRAREATLLKQNCELEEDGCIQISKIPKDAEWLVETGIPEYCDNLMKFTDSLFDELSRKYTNKENSLKSLLKRRSRQEALLT